MHAPQEQADVERADGNNEESLVNVELTSPEVQPMPEDVAQTEEELHKRRRNVYKKLFLGILLVSFIIFVIVDSTTNGYIKTAIDSFLKWIEENPVAGIFVFMIVYFTATVLFIPGSILTLGAGFVFAKAFGLGAGVVLGSLSVVFGASAGAIAAFLLGRYILRDWVQGLTKRYSIFEALDIAMATKGFRIMALLRLSPIIPFNAINYIGGVTAISFTSYSAALIAILPGTTLYVFLGASAGSLSDSAGSGGSSTVTIVVVVVGAVFGIAAIVVTSYYAKKELHKVVEARRLQAEDVADSSPPTQEG